MANDLEKENKALEKQNQKLEKKNKKLGKKNKRGGIIIMILILIIVLLCLAVFLFDPLGFGNGMGILLNDKTGDHPQLQLETTASVQNEAADPEINYIDVTVSGGTYLVGGAEKSVDDIVNTAQNTENAVVRITDNDATVNAMQALTDALRSSGTAYSETTE